MLRLLLILLIAIPASAQSREEDRAYRLAADTLRNEQYAWAADYFRQFLNEYPQSSLAAEARFGLARALEMQGDTEAIAVYREYLRLHAGSEREPDIRYGIAKAFYNAGSWQEARAEFNDFVRRFPNHSSAPLALYYEGQTLLKTGRPELAVPLFQAAEKSGSPSLKGEAAYAVAAAYFQAGDHDRAAEILSVVGTKYAGTSVAARAEGLSADILFRQGRFGEARSRYTRALNAELPYSDELLFWRGWSAIRAGDTAAGVADLISVAEKYPSSRRASEALRNAADLARSAGDTLTAIRALEHRSADPAAILERGRIRLGSGDLAGAQRDFLEVLTLADDNAEAEFLLGIVAVRSKDFPAAESFFRSAEEKSRGTPLEEEILFARLDLIRESGKIGEYAELVARLERSRSSSLPRVLFAGAMMYDDAGRMDEAVREYSKIIRQYSAAPEALDAHYRLGELHYRAARYAASESSFIAFIRRAQGDDRVDDAWYWIGLSRYQTGKLKDAGAAFEQAARTPGSNMRLPAIVRSGDVAFGLKNYQEAIEAYERIIADPGVDSETLFDALFNRAEALRSLGRLDEAVKAFRDIYFRGGASREQALFAAAGAFADAGRETAAIDIYEECAARFETPSRREEALLRAGILRAGLGQPREALMNFENVTKFGGAHAAEAFFRIGTIRETRADSAAARAAFQAAAESHPNSLYGRRAMVRAAMFESDPTAMLQRVIAAGAGDLPADEARAKLGVVAFRGGFHDSAIAYLKAALNGLSDGDALAEAKLALASAYLAKKMNAPARAQAQYVYRSPLYVASARRAEAGLILAEILAAMNQKAEAHKVLVEVADMYPDFSARARQLIESRNLGGTQ